MPSLVELLCFLCISVTSLPYPQTSRELGDIRFTHEILSRGQHLLRLSSASAFVFSNQDQLNYMFAFADDFARHTCPGDFRFIERRRLMPVIHPALSYNFVFRCL